MNLSWKLAGVLSGDLPETVLDSYEAERRPHAHAMIKLAKLIGAAMTRGGRAGNALRKLIAPRLHLLPGLRERVLDSETPPLHGSALVHRPPARRSLAGRLCPNAALGDGRRLDDLETSGFLLVTTATPTCRGTGGDSPSAGRSSSRSTPPRSSAPGSPAATPSRHWSGPTSP